MNLGNVVLVAHQEQENLGVGYLTSMLEKNGFKVLTLDLKLTKDKLCDEVKDANPLLVGFSLIFQYHASELHDLAAYLRSSGVDCHFTIGGHFPSLRYVDTLHSIPEIDSVVRFEGEYTLCELALCLANGTDWKSISGIAYLGEDGPVSNELRQLIENLDELPFPRRNPDHRYMCLGVRCAFVLASRGCIRNCTFCSVREFYQTPSGKVRRSRSPRNVVLEMKELYKSTGTQIFLFQDDDFIVPNPNGQEWIQDFLNELHKNELADQAIFKISCRADEVEPELFRELRDSGLFMVYMGIESGNPEGLKLLNKQIVIEDNIKTIGVLNDLGIMYDYGFMLFNPITTFNTIEKDIEFLRRICGDGSSQVVFGKMIPYASTPIESKLKEEGRLRGSMINPDYDFLDSRINDLYSFLVIAFRPWIQDKEGVFAKVHWHRFEVAVLKKFYPMLKMLNEYEKSLRTIVASYNEVFFHTVESASILFQNDNRNLEDDLLKVIDNQNQQLLYLESQRLREMIDFQISMDKSAHADTD